MEAQIKKDERIEFRVSPEDKEIFLRAQKLSGDKTFSSFVTRIVRTEATHIIEQKERILASERDKELFFKAIFRDAEPNKTLSDAAKKYQSIQKNKL